MTKKAAIARAVGQLKTVGRVERHDPEGAHGSADKILLELLRDLGAGEVADEYRRLVEACPWWG